MKPGKPLTFAEIYSPAKKVLAFGLPGNPVSCLVCFHLFVVPSIHKLAGWENLHPLRFAETSRKLVYSVASFFCCLSIVKTKHS